MDSLPSPPAWTPRRTIFLGVIAAILGLSLTIGIRLMNARVNEGTAAARDARRMADLQLIVTRALEIYESEKILPKTLGEIEEKTKARLSVADPQTFEVYEYNVLGENRFEVCARFEEGASGGPEEHAAGRSCFEAGVG